MRILVTGAGGYIGSQTCKLLTQQGHQVIANDINPVKHNYYHQIEVKNFADIPTGMYEELMQLCMLQPQVWLGLV